MTININPFIVTGTIPAPYFCDRVEEIKVLRQAVLNQMNVVITSPRRMGKTALVDFVFHQEIIEKNYFTISVDILHTTCFKEFIYMLGAAVYEKVVSKSDKMKRLFISTLRSLLASFGYEPIQNTPTSTSSWVTSILPETIEVAYRTFRGVTLYVQRIMKDAYAIYDEGEAKSISSAAFTKKHKLKPSSATQSAVQKLLEDDILTRNEKIYSVADPLLEIWLNRHVGPSYK